ncbi:hypothetical protein GCM10025867_46890 (plasmid) [Frondihabitans sucicola]|uniref:WD40 repeat domain-containing protein n=1 Tax=Frondihabitans sucicola TaxID=1268041 RepID=A0ABM8GVE3_9MICO|nr:hypothetical protein [Frondihabitans sucicola]BDZ52448.1 hypothetical protein GCM10025867_46890 [Frondihabitans sucicola]
MNAAAKAAATIALAAALAFSAAGCSTTTASPAPSAAAVHLNGLPATFTGATSTVDGVTRYASGANGWVASTIKSGKARIAYFDTSGHALWSGPLSATPSALYIVSEGGHDWIIARVGAALSIFDSQSQGQNAKPLHRLNVGSASIAATSTRLLLTSSQPRLLNAAEGSTTVVTLPSGASALAATSDGVLMAHGKTLVGLGSDSGGWKASDVRPSEADSTAAPLVLGVSNGLVVVSWGNLVALHRIADGTVIGEGQAPVAKGAAPIVSADSTVVILGDTVLTVGSMSASHLPQGFEVSSAFEGVLYGETDAGAATLDSISMEPVAKKAPRGVPSAFTLWRTGLFTSPASENGTFSVTIAPLRALDGAR